MFQIFQVLQAGGVRCRSVVERLLMVQWVIRSILHGGPIELFFVEARTGVIEDTVCGILSVGWCI